MRGQQQQLLRTGKAGHDHGRQSFPLAHADRRDAMTLGRYSRVTGPVKSNPGAPRPWNTSVNETFERAIYPLAIV